MHITHPHQHRHHKLTRTTVRKHANNKPPLAPRRTPLDPYPSTATPPQLPPLSANLTVDSNEHHQDVQQNGGNANAAAAGAVAAAGTADRMQEQQQQWLRKSRRQGAIAAASAAGVGSTGMHCGGDGGGGGWAEGRERAPISAVRSSAPQVCSDTRVVLDNGGGKSLGRTLLAVWTWFVGDTLTKAGRVTRDFLR